MIILSKLLTGSSLIMVSCDVTLHLDITVGGNQAITEHSLDLTFGLLLPAFFCTVRFFTAEVSLQGWN